MTTMLLYRSVAYRIGNRDRRFGMADGADRVSGAPSPTCVTSEPLSRCDVQLRSVLDQSATTNVGHSRPPRTPAPLTRVVSE